MAYKYTQEEIKDLEKLLKEYRNTKHFRKIQAVYLSAKSYTLKEVSEATGYEYRYISKIKRKYASEGKNYLVTTKVAGGNNRRVPKIEEQKILQEIYSEVKPGTISTIKHLKKLFEERVGFELPYSTFYDILKRNNWVKIVPRKEHPKKATEAEIKDSKKLK